uniref:Uncharacterized protein n=1 Tax=Glossina palpalis gambiensis TaxID=67801 RepID=A0A1B0B512_9MUSC
MCGCVERSEYERFSYLLFMSNLYFKSRIRMRLYVLCHSLDIVHRFLQLLRKGGVIMQMSTITRTYEKTLRKRIKRNKENF